MDTTPFDLIVVGAGVMGSATAYYAARSGASVLLLEQHRFLHRRGSSHGESRITRRTYPSDTYTSLTGPAHAAWRELECEAGETLFTTTGGIDVLDRGSTLELAFVDSCARNRIPLKELTVPELAALGLHPRIGTVSYWQPESGVLHATSAVAALQRLAAVRGAKLRDACEVTQLVDGVDGSGRRTVRVVARDGRSWTARRVVIAPGAWAAPVLRRLCGLGVKLEVTQTTVMYFRSNPSFTSSSGATADDVLAKQPVIVDYGTGGTWTSTPSPPSGSTGGASPASEDDCPLIYSCPSVEFPGLTKFAVHNGVVTTADERTFVPDVGRTVEPVRRWLRNHAPFVSPDPVFSETCLYTSTPDDDFIVDQHPLRPHIVVAAGFSGHGFKFACVVGQATATLALTGASPIDLTAFRLSRPCLGLVLLPAEAEFSCEARARL